MEISRKRPYDHAMNGTQTELFKNGNSTHLSSFRCTLNRPVMDLSLDLHAI